MKKITRMFVFTSLAIYLTSLWDKGFIIKYYPKELAVTIVALVALYYIIVPLMKLVLLPLNILTLGMVSLIAYFLLFYFFTNRFSLLEIKEWTFPGLKLLNFTIPKMYINYVGNVVVSAASLSFIINFFEAVL